MSNKKPNILFLPAWYPNRYDAMFGLFVKNHALAILPHANISVIYVQSSVHNSNTYEVEINTEEGIYEHFTYYKKCSLPGIASLINLFRMLMAYRMAWKQINNEIGKPDLSHAHILTRAGFISLLLKTFYKIPYVITEHWSRYYSFNDSYNGYFRKVITKIVVKKANAMSTVSNSLKTAMNEAGLQNPNWKIIPNSIDTNIFVPSKEDNQSSKVRLFHISCFEDKSKNVSGIIRAFAQALQSNNKLELVMIGTGMDHKKVVDLASELKINDSIEFTGELTPLEVSRKISSCQFQVLFSNYETFAIVIIESLAAGKPVIATEAGAIPEVLPKEYGMLIKPKDEQALSNAILLMADNYKNYDIEAMRNYAINNYDKPKVGKLLMDFYSQAISN